MFRCLKIFICMLSYFHLIFFQFKFSFRRSIQFIFLRRREIRNFLNFSFLIRYSKIQFLLNFQYIYVIETCAVFRPGDLRIGRSESVRNLIFLMLVRVGPILFNSSWSPGSLRSKSLGPRPASTENKLFPYFFSMQYHAVDIKLENWNSLSKV